MKIFCLGGVVSALLPIVAFAEPSKLWGNEGELWDPAGRLPDVSFAGYAAGERPIPDAPVVANVRDFGAKGDGVADDSEAFLEAIAAGKKGAILIPEGRYKITKILKINKPGIVLRGEGPDRSVLVFPIPLNEIEPNWGATTGGSRTSNYSWWGGFVWFQGWDKGEKLGEVVAAAKRGDRVVQVSGDFPEFEPGSWVKITVRDDEAKSLLEHLYSGDPGNVSRIEKHETSFVTRARLAEDGRLELERPLRIDLRPEWKPEVHGFKPGMIDSGVEDLAFEFPARDYGGHFSELGYNAVAFSLKAADCWARNLRITNADSGFFAQGRFCTIENVTFQTTEDAGEAKGGVFGHHGASLTGDDNLFTGFDLQQRFIHDFTVSGGAGNVFSSGKGLDLSLDHHKRAPHDNVFTDVDLGEGTRMWRSGGGADLGRHSGARGTFWNVRGERPQVHPGEFGPASLNLVAVTTEEKEVTEPDGRWLETIRPEAIQPANLHEAQRKRRLERGPRF